MEAQNYTVWIPFYMEFADVLLQYAEDRIRLVEKLKHVYSKIGIKFLRIDSGAGIIDIDPFTVFGLFNRDISCETRISMLTGIKEEFAIKAPVPKNFDGVPVLSTSKSIFFKVKAVRGKNDIQNLWKLFISALKYADAPEKYIQVFKEAYTQVINQKGIRWNISVGLYWIRPYVFLPMDSITRWFCHHPISKNGSTILLLKDLGLSDMGEMPTTDGYLNIIADIKFKMDSGNFIFSSFPEIAYLACKQNINSKAEAAAEAALRKKEASQRGRIGQALADGGLDIIHYWIYSPGDNACMWDEFYNEGIMAIGWSEIGDLRNYDSKHAMKMAMRQNINPELSFKNAVHATWQFANEMEPGDIIFVKKGMHTIVGMGTVTSDYEFDGDRSDDYKNLRHVNWSHAGTWDHPGQAVMKTLTDITLYDEYVKKLLALFEEGTSDDTEEKIVENPTYTSNNFLSEVFMTKDDYDTLVNLLIYKKNIILQGAPGVGKTFAAKRLAYSFMGEKDPSRVAMIQFHQSYSYEDFIVGFRPDGTGFKLNYGPFYNFCKKAEIDLDNPYFFIIDEINRGNLSKIFGELFMLIEKDKRGIPLQLLYSDEKFTVPENVYIIGMMNTADRSLALLDYALRRRFAFYNMIPAFKSENFQEYLQAKNSEKLKNLIAVVQNINVEITKDEALGPGFCIGHSYFCTEDEVTDIWLRNIVNYELLPLLGEYWFDEPDKVQEWTWKLREAIK